MARRWLNATSYSVWLSRRDADVAALRLSLGHSPNATAIVYFPAFLADAVHNGAALARLDSVITHFACNGVRPSLLVGRPEFYGAGRLTRDVVHNSGA